MITDLLIYHFSYYVITGACLMTLCTKPEVFALWLLHKQERAGLLYFWVDIIFILIIWPFWMLSQYILRVVDSSGEVGPSARGSVL